MILNTLFSKWGLFHKTRPIDPLQEQLTELQKSLSDLNAKMYHLVTENEKVKSLIGEISKLSYRQASLTDLHH